jgi:AGZA family xanthine/uracil permease-like MFS transporter
MAYIVALNPLILATTDGTGAFIGGGDRTNAIIIVAAGTALIAGLLTMLMGAVANFPLALATGLGLNTFVAVSIAKNATWAQAMGLVVLEGIVILILVLTGFRIAVFKAIPTALKVAISVGIGLFIALIGLVDSGFVRRTPNMVWGSENSKPTAVPLELGDGGQLVGWPIVVFTVGLLLTIILMVKKIKGSILIGIVTSTILAIIVEAQFKVGNSFISPTESNSRGWGLNTPSLPKGADGSLNFTDTPRFDTLGLGFDDIFGAFTNPKTGFLAALLLVFTLLLADFFDTMGTMTAIGNQAGLTDSKGNVEGANRILIVDSIAAATGGAAGISSNTSYIESATGVGEGARTGLASIVTGILFLLTTFLAPLVAVIPYEAATPALIIVGFLMMSQVKNIEWDDLGIGIPAFLTIILMPFTYNISVGIGAGFVSHVLIRLVQGRRKEVHPLLYLVSGLFMIYFLSSPIKSWIG